MFANVPIKSATATTTRTTTTAAAAEGTAATPKKVNKIHK